MCEDLRKLCEEVVEEQYKKILDEKDAELEKKDAYILELEKRLEMINGKASVS